MNDQDEGIMQFYAYSLPHCGLAQVDYASNPQETEREVGIVLPVGCGKSGTITLATANRADLDDAHVVITNIHQLQGEANRWLQALPADYFDLILFDEGHHSVADSWETLRVGFPLGGLNQMPRI